MCEQGRILHHLRNNLDDPRNTVLITGFQAQDTLGRKLVEKMREVRIFGEPVTVRAEISSLDELSGHADQGELMEWMKPLAPALEEGFPGAWRAGTGASAGRRHTNAIRRGGGSAIPRPEFPAGP